MTGQPIPTTEDIRLARVEKSIETLEAENFGLKQRIKELEDQIRYDFPPIKEPIEVIGSWHKTKGNSL
ncbi:MAG: hypothetical protein EBZ44_05795 [Verrucomicrobia bacterium]|nr:hypothetical protein [bacterium]NDA10104.1 hypothetical protein [Verrucomicrobiota bacterium]NDD57213.1 hypothetical protein [Verrucomicrobiota bacterium]NDD82288.1 hypothetical protein [Verrucomicrobiota bacterium]